MSVVSAHLTFCSGVLVEMLTIQEESRALEKSGMSAYFRVPVSLKMNECLKHKLQEFTRKSGRWDFVPN